MGNYLRRRVCNGGKAKHPRKPKPTPSPSSDDENYRKSELAAKIAEVIERAK